MYINWSNVIFNCPYCDKQYDDLNEKYLKKLNNNNSNYTTIKCSCNHKFKMTYNIQGDAVAFI